MDERALAEWVSRYDLQGELERRIVYRDGPVSELQATAKELSVTARSESSIRVEGRLHFEYAQGDGDFSMRSSGDPPFVLELELSSEGDVLGGTLQLAGFAPIDLEKDRAEFEEALGRALTEMVPGEGETWGQALVRHDGGVAVGTVGHRRFANLEAADLAPRVTTLFDGLMKLREQAFAEQPDLRHDESDGWTGSALDNLGNMIGRTWRPTLEDHISLVKGLTKTVLEGDEAARNDAFSGDQYFAVEAAFQALEKDAERSGDDAMKELRDALAPHAGSGVAGYFADVTKDWFWNR